MKKKKYSSFYYIVDKNIYSDINYWELYNKNESEAIKKYDNNIYCPECLRAPLTVAKGRERQYFKVHKTNMNKHYGNCSYLLSEFTKIETEEFYKNITTKRIANELFIAMNRITKKEYTTEDKSGELNNSKNEEDFYVSQIENKNNKKGYITHVNLYSKKFKESIGSSRVYFGKCKMYCYINANNNKEIQRYYLKILNYKTDKIICSISITAKVFSYLQLEKYQFSYNKEKPKMYFLSFFANLYYKTIFLNANLEHSKRLLFKEAKFKKNEKSTN